jgi:hypothetical protein
MDWIIGDLWLDKGLDLHRIVIEKMVVGPKLHLKRVLARTWFGDLS